MFQHISMVAQIVSDSSAGLLPLRMCLIWFGHCGASEHSFQMIAHNGSHSDSGFRNTFLKCKRADVGKVPHIGFEQFSLY